ncbi:MAG TPA: HAD family hydrolase [Pirellulales bacterium]|jgi:phosphoglycolate phosphatase-like HAD superfamily hydrolase|nr:HAD family hydrolase [Pirellulales bacterium]
MFISADSIELVRPDFARGKFRAVLFDFDGTLSLVRRNWQNVMIPMMVDVLAATGTAEPSAELHAHVEEFVMRLNGKQTIYQMMQLVEEVKLRGGEPRTPLEYKHQYHDLLWAQISHRVSGLKDGTIDPEELTVPGAHRLLDRLSRLGVTLWLASGTDLKYVEDELRALRLDGYFGPRVYGALDNHRDFSKALIIERMIHEMGVAGDELLAFGDGFVEIEETRRVGGVAIGVASEEETRSGVNAWKRQRLLRAGADVIIGDYRCQEELLGVLGLGLEGGRMKDEG